MLLAKRKGFLYLIKVFILLQVGWVNSFAQNINLSPQQTYFIQSICKHSFEINQSIAKDRQHLDFLYKKFLNHVPLSSIDIYWIHSIANSYGIKIKSKSQNTINDLKIWATLQDRIDTLPISLILAQAIYESGWGQSRFAREANNYFGYHCHQVGCGLIPKERSPLKMFEVQRFSNMYDSINYYIHNINTHNSYTYLRKLRTNSRIEGKSPSGSLLANGLTYYADKLDYTKNIKQLIQQYNLAQYDSISELPINFNTEKELYNMVVTAPHYS